ncbi:MAG: serine protein kinase, partial [Pseudobdellovibrionaceae bacterium]
MAENHNVNITNVIENWKAKNQTAHLHWSGSFNDYIALVKKNPKLTRNAFQRMYDMIVEAGTEDYEDFKKKVIRYKFFEDAHNNGKDAVFGLDISLMKLVNVLKSAALGYGTEKRVILLHGPVGSAKSTICRMLKKGLEAYSRSETGALYTFEWTDEKGELDGLFGKGAKAFQSP